MSKVEKPRVLLVGECNYLSTGYGVISRELGSRLARCSDIEFAEFSTHADPALLAAHKCPWTVYSNNPTTEEENRVFNSHHHNQFGKWKFEQTCLDFKANLVFTYLDPFMFEYMPMSPYRRFFNLALCPPVDGSPQLEEWIELYRMADYCGFYSKWGEKVAQEQAGGSIRSIGHMPPAVNYEQFYAIPNKRDHKESMGLERDCLIVGTTMRNQPRKQYPQLIRDFELVLGKLSEEKRSKTYMWWHTAWPDIGWDIPRIIKESPIGHKVLFTYTCGACGRVFPDFFKDVNTFCRKCGQFSARMPGTRNGVKSEDLNKIYNCMDIFVQYSNCEGFGIPVIEAAACQVPTLVVNYSSMEDFVNFGISIPIGISQMVKDPPTFRDFAIPHREDFADKVAALLVKPSQMREVMGGQARQRCQKHYNWDLTAQKWAELAVTMQPKMSWKSPAQLISPVIPNGNFTPAEFVRRCLIQIAGRPDLVNSHLAKQFEKYLIWGKAPLQLGMSLLSDSAFMCDARKDKDFGREQLIAECQGLAERFNIYEKMRVEKTKSG